MNVSKVRRGKKVHRQMLQKGLPHEVLKLIACACMLLDHIGMVVQVQWLRLIGRLAFPIFCFLLVEGARHTRNPKGYGLRLFICAVLSELPFDLLLFGGFSWERQNVMATLLLGFGMLRVWEKTENPWGKLLTVLIAAVAAGLLRLDYGVAGILLIAVFALAQDNRLRTVLVGAIMLINGGAMQLVSVLAMVPIALYSGRKATKSKAVQWIFYLFYPAHMLLLYTIY